MKILCFSDSVTVSTGFARVAQNLYRRWHAAGVTVDNWGIGFSGTGYRAHPYINELFPGGGGGEWYQIPRLQAFLRQLLNGGYTHVFILQDTFIMSANGFPEALCKVCREKNIRSVYYFPVDAPLDPDWTAMCSAVDVAVAYTEFGRAEAMAKHKVWRDGHKEHKRPPGLRCLALPHGVETEIYHPLPDRAEARATFWKERWVAPDDFLLLNVSANQRRKDVARSLEILAALRAMDVPAKLVMHMRETSGEGLSLEAVGEQLGLELDVHWGHHGKFFQTGLGTFSEAQLARLYNTADCLLSTSLGEGWGLPLTEALACGCVVALPDHTACRELADEVTRLGQGAQMIRLPTEAHRLVLEQDNSRLRPRVDVAAAAAALRDYWQGGRAVFKPRPPLNDALRGWLDWDRIAAEFLKLLAPSGVQASATHELQRA